MIANKRKILNTNWRKQVPAEEIKFGGPVVESGQCQWPYDRLGGGGVVGEGERPANMGLPRPAAPGCVLYSVHSRNETEAERTLLLLLFFEDFPAAMKY